MCFYGVVIDGLCSTGSCSNPLKFQSDNEVVDVSTWCALCGFGKQNVIICSVAERLHLVGTGFFYRNLKATTRRSRILHGTFFVHFGSRIS